MLAYLLAVACLGALVGSAFGYYLGRRDTARQYEDRLRMMRAALRAEIRDEVRESGSLRPVKPGRDV